MSTAGSGGTPAVSFGPFVPMRFGRPSTPLATCLWLVIAFLNDCVPLGSPITWIAVTRLRIQTAGAVLPTTLRITWVLAGSAVAAGEEVLFNALRAGRRAVDNLTKLTVKSTTAAFPGAVKWRTQINSTGSTPQTDTPKGRTRIERETEPALDRIPDPGRQPGQNSRPQPKTRESKINNSAGPPDRRPAHLSRRPPPFAGASI